MDEHTQTETSADSLNVRLAKWAGWRVEARQLDGDDRYYVLFRPDGTQVAALDGGYEVDEFWTASEAWQHAPDYAGSLDAGMALVPDDGRVVFYMLFKRVGDKMVPVYCAELETYNYAARGVNASESFMGYAEALAHALDALRASQEAER